MLAIILITLAIGVGVYIFQNKENNSNANIVNNEPKVSLVPTEIVPSISGINPSIILTPTLKIPTNTPTPKIASLTLKLKTKNSTEIINNFVGEIYDVKTGNIIVKFDGNGKEKVIKKISNGDYRLKIIIGNDLNNYGCGYSNYEEFSIKNGDNLVKEIEILPYTGIVYLKSEDYFPLSSANVSLVNETGDKVYYSTIADNFGRAVINTININPHWLKITTFDQTQIIKIDNGKCLWSETIKLPISVDRSTLKVNIVSTTNWLAPQLVKKYEPLIVPDAMPSFNLDAAGKYLFIESLCVGNFAMTFGTNLTQLQNEDNSYLPSYEIKNILPGKYFVCAYDPSKAQLMSYKSDWKEVELVLGQTTEINLNYPEQ